MDTASSHNITRFHSKLSYHAMLLGGVCAIVSILLLFGNEETKPRIEKLIEADKVALLTEVFPDSLYDNEPLSTTVQLAASAEFSAPIEVSTATLNGAFSGAILQSAVPGWGDNIYFILAVDQNMKITGVRVVSHKETPGLADGIERNKSDWIDSFLGKSLSNTPGPDWRVKKDGGEFDQFTGATITPRAMVNGVYHALLQLQQWREQTPREASE
ncbi:RnfABCDGE type electron transport complex subunit G [Aurantivibrio plasticivorans]